MGTSLPIFSPLDFLMDPTRRFAYSAVLVVFAGRIVQIYRGQDFWLPQIFNDDPDFNTNYPYVKGKLVSAAPNFDETVFCTTDNLICNGDGVHVHVLCYTRLCDIGAYKYINIMGHYHMPSCYEMSMIWFMM